MRGNLCRPSSALWLAVLLLPASAGAFTFTVDPARNTFRYTDAERSFTGIFVKPAGNGPFPAVIINHGQGGTPASYSLPKANEMAAWGLVGIGPALTHASGGDTSPEGSGSSPENVARGEAVLAALASLGYVDMDRVAVWGHSKGAYASIGQVAAMGRRIRAAGMSAGGIVPGTVAAGARQAAPTEGEAAPTVTPFLMFHGTVDPAVPPPTSASFASLLEANGVPHRRITYTTNGLSSDLQHNLHKTARFNADMLATYREWLTQHGVLGGASSSGRGPGTAAISLATSSPADVFAFPRGIYALGTAQDNPSTPDDERLSGIRGLDYVSGYALRLLWSDIDDGNGGYRFGVIDEALARVAPLGQRLNLEILLSPPAAVVAAARMTYVDERGDTVPVPWDPGLRRAHRGLFAALAGHRPRGSTTRLADLGTLSAVDNSVPGFSQGLRDINSRLQSSPFYDRSACLEAVLDAVDTGRRAFPRHLGYVAFFTYDDGRGTERVDQILIDRLAASYNGPGQPPLAFFIENLSDNGPLPLSRGVGTGNNLRRWSDLGGTTMMQALTAWTRPFTGASAVTSGNPATGIALAYETYGTRYFELYVADLDKAAAGGRDAGGRRLEPDLREWSTRLRAGEP